MPAVRRTRNRDGSDLRELLRNLPLEVPEDEESACEGMDVHGVPGEMGDHASGAPPLIDAMIECD